MGIILPLQQLQGRDSRELKDTYDSVKVSIYSSFIKLFLIVKINTSSL